MAADERPSPTDTADAATDPNDRVHHHARTDEPRRGRAWGPIVTLCGLKLTGRRPEAAGLPCCPMCAAEMGALGRRCP